MNEADFDTLDESLRGNVPEGYWKNITISFNPWNERHWLKKRFFDRIVGFDSTDTPIYEEIPQKEVSEGSFTAYKEDTLIKTTTYKCNEWLDDKDIKVFERMKVENPRRYNVAGLGNWGIVEGLVYENFVEKDFDIKDIRKLKMVCAIDFGFSNDPTAILIAFVDKTNNLIYIWDEVYEKNLTNWDIKAKIIENGWGSYHFICDSAEPKSIEELKYLGIRCKPAKKGRDSIRSGIQYIQNFKIIIHPRCVNFITEINNYSWAKDKFGKFKDEPIDDFNHLQDCLRYALSELSIGNGWAFSKKQLM